MKDSILTKNQTKQYRAEWTEKDGRHLVVATVRYDDRCGNGHNTFSITGEEYSPKGDRREGSETTSDGKMVYMESCGCIHDTISKRIPELAPLIKWHLCNSDGPWGYIPNTLYYAGDRDCWGGRKGEVRSYSHAIRFGNSPISHEVKKGFVDFVQDRIGTGTFLVVALAHEKDQETYGTHYTFAGYAEEWHKAPFRKKNEAEEWAEALNSGIDVQFLRVPDSYHEGKERDFDAARSSAVWPEATDEELSQEPEDLKQALANRLPALREEFCSDVERLGLVY